MSAITSCIYWAVNACITEEDVADHNRKGGVCTMISKETIEGNSHEYSAAGVPIAEAPDPSDMPPQETQALLVWERTAFHPGWRISKIRDRPESRPYETH